MDNQQSINQELRVQNPNDAHDQAYIEDFAYSMQHGKEPALIQHSKTDIEQSQINRQQAMDSMEQLQALHAMNGPSSMDTKVEQMASQPAEGALQDAPDGQSVDKSNHTGKQQGKPNRFTRALSRIAAPVLKAEAFIQGQRQAQIQHQIDVREGMVKLHQEQLQREQARMEALVQRQQAKDAKRQAFKQSITNSGKNLKGSIQKQFSRTGNFVKGAVDKGRGVPRFVSAVVSDVQDGWNESRSFVNDTLDRGRSGVQSVKSRVAERHAPVLSTDASTVTYEDVINRMAERMKEKHTERSQFNTVMNDVHGKDVGYRRLEISDAEGPDDANRMAHLETRAFVNTGDDGKMQVQHNASYYQYMLDMKSEQALSDTNGQMEGMDYRDRAKELYELLLEEKGETESKKELNARLMESYDSSYPSKRLNLYLAKNPSLTRIDDGLTAPTVDSDVDVSWPYQSMDADKFDQRVENAYNIAPDEGVTAAEREQSINKEFNGVPIEHEGYIDLNQEDPKVVHLETARMQREGSLAAVASGKPSPANRDSMEMLKGVFRTEHRYSKNAVDTHKQSEQLSLNLGSLDGPEGP